MENNNTHNHSHAEHNHSHENAHHAATHHKSSDNEVLFAALAYIVFFLPLIFAKDSAFAKFHANQGLNLLLVAIIGSVVLGLIPFLGWMLLPLLNLVVIIFCILGIVNAVNKKEEKLPVIGDWFNLLK